MSNSTDLGTGDARRRKTASTRDKSARASSAKSPSTKTAKSQTGKTDAKAKSTRKNTALGGPVHMSPEERYRLVAEAAYLRAEQRGFNGGDPTADWLAAEAEIDAALSRRH